MFRTRRTGYLNFVSPPSPPRLHSGTFHGQRLSPWLVKTARARPVMVTGHICIFVPEADGLNVLIAGFRSELVFFQMITAHFQHAWSIPGRHAAARDVRRRLWRGIWATIHVKFADWKIRRLGLEETPVSGAQRVRRCVDYRSTSPYFWPVVWISLYLWVVCCMFWKCASLSRWPLVWGTSALVGRGGKRKREADAGGCGGAKGFSFPTGRNLWTQFASPGKSEFQVIRNKTARIQNQLHPSKKKRQALG